MAAGMEAERAGLAKQFHTCFFRCAASFAIVTTVAAGDQILPGGFTGAGAGNDMIEGHFAGG